MIIILPHDGGKVSGGAGFEASTVVTPKKHLLI